MFVVTVNFTIKSDHVDDFREAVEKQASNSLELEAGCHQFDVCYDLDDDTAAFLYEIYSDEEAFEDHLESDHFESFDASTGDWVEEKLVRQWALA